MWSDLPVCICALVMSYLLSDMLELFEINCGVCHETVLRIRESLRLTAVITFYLQVSLFCVI
jgi:hypothetical protein